ncbi:hypothetical protein [Paraburkholderia sp. J12]|uniref:hypothetical protein n=1 Tax=Paraburkholderia sp. J12 TaxID=2805432 RepID=UPI002ABE9B3B|nr:hypothetical protein [Paraburkholderia sp. J12]
MATRLTALRPDTSRSARWFGIAATLLLAAAIAAFAYWQAAPVKASRETYAACAGHAAAELHAPDPRVRQQATDTLVECASRS